MQTKTPVNTLPAEWFLAAAAFISTAVGAVKTIVRRKLVAPSAEAAAADRNVRKVLTDNTKLRKTPSGAVVINAGISLAPASRSGIFNLCPDATIGCLAGCVLWFGGRTVTAVVRRAAIARSALLVYWPERFFQRLFSALVALERRADKKGARAFCRTNVASDVNYPSELYRAFPRTTFYNYSKNCDHIRDYINGFFPFNYFVSYSVSERSRFSDCAEFNRAGVNLIVVFDSYYSGPLHRFGYLPERVEFRSETTGESFTVDCVDGDISDLRTPEFDGRGVCVGLRLKGTNKAKLQARRFGFARPFPIGAEYVVRRMERKGTAVVILRD